MDIPYEQYEGNVGAFGLSLALMALGMTSEAYGLMGQPGASRAAGISLAPQATGLIQTLTADQERLRAEGNAIRTLAEAAGSYTDEQRTRRDEIVANMAKNQADIDGQRALDAILLEAPATSTEPGDGVSATTADPRPFRTLGQQLQAVHSAATQKSRPIHPGLVAIDDHFRVQAAASGANEIVGADGGFTVQSDFTNELLDRVIGQSILAPRCRSREIGPNANGHKYNVIDETSRADGSRFGGVRAYWTGESGSLTASRPKMTQQELTLQKLTGLYYATDEELADDVALTSATQEMFPEEFGFKLDDAIVRGTGAGMPQGWLTSDALVTVSKESGQAADTILAENVEKMFARLWAPSMRNAFWYVNQAVYPQLFQMQHVIGTGGVPVFLPPAGISGAPFGTLFGRPIEPIEQASALGDLGDISLVDLNQYQLIRKGGIAQASSIHVLFTTDEMAFRWVLRINGRTRWYSALTPYKGSDTLSPFVTLQAR